MQFEFSSYETCPEIYSLEEKVFIVHTHVYIVSTGARVWAENRLYM